MVLFRRIPHVFDLPAWFLYRFPTGCASCDFEELPLGAPLVFASYLEQPPARFAFVIAYERLLPAVEACRSRRSAATGAYGVFPRYWLQADRALIPEWAAGAAFGAKSAVPLDKFPALDAGLLI